jgi:hypothetical protein
MGPAQQYMLECALPPRYLAYVVGRHSKSVSPKSPSTSLILDLQDITVTGASYVGIRAREYGVVTTFLRNPLRFVGLIHGLLYLTVYYAEARILFRSLKDRRSFGKRESERALFVSVSPEA